jgi:hypothetical protein
MTEIGVSPWQHLFEHLVGELDQPTSPDWAGGTVAAPSLMVPRLAAAQSSELQPWQIPIAAGINEPTRANHWYIPASDKTVHWGYFSKGLKPVVEVHPGDYITVECLTHQASDDYDRMIMGDPGAESVYYWTKTRRM